MTELIWQLADEILQQLAQAKVENQKIVLVTGVFDILHAEHRRFLEKAKNLGQLLLVGLESDVRVKALKGSGRPVNPEQVRLRNLELWKIADAIFVLPEKFQTSLDHERLIGLIRPDVLAVSSHTAFLEKKAEILQKFGGQVIVVHEHNPELSTTKILTAAA